MRGSAAEQRVCEQIAGRSEQLVEELSAMVAIPTAGGNSAGLKELRHRLVSRLVRLGAETELVPGQARPEWLAGPAERWPIEPIAVCRRTSGRSGPRVLLAGHLDTVLEPRPGSDALAISADRRRAEGPGCADMKGGLVVLLAALEALEAADVDLAWTVLLNSDEETGSFSSSAVVRAEAGRHDVGLAVEPALEGGALAIERMGSGQFLIEARGRSAHVGRDFARGVSAVTALARCLVRVAELSDLERGRLVNVGPIEGGRATNAVPDRARAWGNVRYRTQEEGEALARELRALATPADAMPAITVHCVLNRPAKPCIEPVRRLAGLARQSAEDLGQALPFAATGGVCDGNTMQDAGLPTVDTLGVRGGGLHTPDEWVDLTSLVERAQLLAVLLLRLAGGAWDAGRTGDQ